MVDLKDYICKVPFEILEIHDNSYFLCCASWLKNHLPKGIPMKEAWNSNEARDIRKSVLDGSYTYCDKNQCPYLSQLINLNSKSIGPIKHKNELNDTFFDSYDFESGKMNTGPKVVHMSFDRTCNYKCPSCRVEMIVASKDKIEKINTTIEEMENLYAKDIEMIYCSGTADPFASVSYRNYLRNFNPKKYPNLKSIHLHTNASLWNKEMWDSMPNIHKYVHSCEISIDAATEYTYENITRLGGNWNNLVSNLKFISTIKDLRSVKCSFVVQQSNYMEMELFLKTIKDIFKEKTRVFFGRITNWGTFSEKQFNLIDIGNKEHIEHTLFINEFKKVAYDPYVFHNMYELLEIKKSLI